ncbi:MAG TPA: rhomboid family intramembrane serine protease [Gemmatimonadales bacterium]|nr:rhomboid family intramembrane serine protease [Gemmatimonadales bacterium]
MDQQRMFGMTPWVLRLFAANLLVFLLQLTLFTGRWFVAGYGFDPVHAFDRPWTFVTYMFLHGGVLHLAFNLLALFVFGPPVEERLGGKTFIGYYLLCGLGGAVLSYLLAQAIKVGVTIGASGAIFGVALAFAWFWPDQRIAVFPLPAPIPVRWLVAFLVAISLLLAWAGATDGVAHLAHLGGFAAGFLYLKSQDWRLARAERHLRGLAEPSLKVHSAARAAGGTSGPPPRRSRPADRDAVQAEIDRVLDKISARGMASLTPAERKFLAEMSRKMRDRE